jgi:hypothetical protein
MLYQQQNTRCQTLIAAVPARKTRPSRKRDRGLPGSRFLRPLSTSTRRDLGSPRAYFPGVVEVHGPVHSNV